jgi:hypothetical protein
VQALHIPNSGVSRARNAGVAAGTGEGRDHVETALSGCRLLLTRLVTGLS